MTAVLAVFALAAPAAAQTSGYPPGTPPSTALEPAASTTQVAEIVLGPGQTVVRGEFVGCGFRPGTSAQIDYEGQPAGSERANSRGCVTIAYTVQLLTGGNESGAATLDAVLASNGGRAISFVAQAPSCGAIRLTVNGRSFAARAGTNTVHAVGEAANGGTRTFTGLLNIKCAANVVPEQQPETPARGDDEGAFAFTGVNVLRWSLIAVALIAAGGFILRARRRLGSSSPA